MMSQEAVPLPSLAVRGSSGLVKSSLYDGTTTDIKDDIISSNQCRCMKFSDDGEMLAWCDGSKVQVLKTISKEVIFTTDLARTYAMCFSPDGSVLCTWEPFAVTKELPKGKPNWHLWNVTSGECVHEMVQRKVEGWKPVWMPKSICAKQLGNSVHFYANNSFNRGVAKLQIENLESFEVSPNVKPPTRVACFIRGSKGGPSSVRMFNYPHFSPGNIVANKSFFKADTVNMIWNKTGTDLLVKAAVDVDTTGESYYGEQSLHFISSKGEAAIVTLSKKGPIYDAAWSPNATQFCVVFGFMPAKAAVFNLKCNQVFEFGSTPKNVCFFNPQGSLLALAGFGNLRGNIEIWDFEKKKQVTQFQSPDTTYFEWCADGSHFVTATTAPRLRVGNGYKLWNFKSGMCFEHKAKGEIHEVAWQPKPEGTYAAPVIDNVSTKEIKAIIGASKPTAYVPPHARGNKYYEAAKNKFERDDEEPASTEEKLSKSALKNKRRKEARKKAKQMEEVQTPSFEMPGRTSEQQDAVAMARYLLSDSPAPPEIPVPTNEEDVEKKVKKLRKKLKEIEKLKSQQQEGKQLQKEQLQKLKTEATVLQQIKELEIKS